MRYDPGFIEKVGEANNIIEIVSQYTELKARGQQYVGLCPFPDHNEKTPSFSVSETRQLYHCFGCKKSGNIFTFLETYNGFSFVEALEYLAARAHLKMPESSNNSSPGKECSMDQKQQMFRVNKLAADFYHQKLKSLPKEHRLNTYLKKRHLTNEMIKEFSIGYAPEAWDELTSHLNKKKTPSPLSEKSGLIRKNKKGGYFDLFRDRLMFPIVSIESHVIGFGGRVIKEGEPKYINSPESYIFKKGQNFYGLDKSIRFIRSEDQVFVVEGYMDFLALYSQGIKNVVATLGTALTEKHVRLLKRWTKNIILIFDGDEAGQRAAQGSLIQFFKENLSPGILLLPEKMDPDDFIHNFGREEFLKKVQGAEDLFLNLTRTWLANDRGQPADKIRFLDKISPLLKSLKDPRLLQMYIQELAPHLNESPKKLYSWVMMGREKLSRTINPTAPGTPLEPENSLPTRVSLDGATEDELVLLGLSLKSLKYMDFFVTQQGLDYLNHKKLKQVFSQAVSKYRQEPKNFDKLANWVLSKIENPEKITSLVNISSDTEYLSSGENFQDKNFNHDENLLKGCLFHIKDRYLRQQAAILVEEMKLDHTDTKLERFMKIQNDRKALEKLKNTPLGDNQ